MSLLNKVAILTGAASGIGAATALKFVQEGAKLVLVDRNESKLRNVANTCEKRGIKPLTIIADLSKDEDAKNIISETLHNFKQLDILVNNAGIGRYINILDDQYMKVFDKLIATNLRAPVYLTHLAAKHIIETKGNIVNIASVSGLAVLGPSNSPYCTSKAGIGHFSRCIALELAVNGVRVNAISPGPVKTEIIENTGLSKEVTGHVWDAMEKITALKRISDPEEIADLVAYLASDRSRGITGSLIVSDNGTLLQPSL